MDAFRRIMDNILLKTPGAVEAVVRSELFNALDEFCRETNCWVYSQKLTVEQGETTTAFAPPDGAQIVRIMLASVSGSPVRVAYRPFELTMLVAPQSAQEVDVVASLAPDVTTDYAAKPAVPDELWNRHYQALVDGTLGRLKAQPAKPYSTLQGATLHYRLFRTAINETRSEVDRAYQYDAQSWSYPYFARGR